MLDGAAGLDQLLEDHHVPNDGLLSKGHDALLHVAGRQEVVRSALRSRVRFVGHDGDACEDAGL